MLRVAYRLRNPEWEPPIRRRGRRPGSRHPAGRRRLATANTIQTKSIARAAGINKFTVRRSPRAPPDRVPGGSSSAPLTPLTAGLVDVA